MTVEFCIPDEEVRRSWPGLRVGSNATVESERDPRYNCVAWAMNDRLNDWQPTPLHRLHTWPDGVPRDPSLGGFIAMFRSQGFEPCPDASLEPDMEKLGIYVDRSGDFTHVAKQLLDGRWTSKLGQLNDIEHNTLEDLVGELYGFPQVYLRKPRST